MLLRAAARQVSRLAPRRPLFGYHYHHHYTQSIARGGGGGGGGGGEQQADRSAVGVFWDFENCHVPSSLDPFLVRPNIERTLRHAGFLGPISIRAYGNIHLLPTHLLEALSETGVDLHHVPCGGKNASDRVLLVDMLLWAMKHSPPTHVLLISADSDFSVLLHKMCLLGYNALLASPKRTAGSSNSALISAANIVWGWPDIVMGPVCAGHEQTSDTTMSDDVSKNMQCKVSQVQPEDDGGDAIMKSKEGNVDVVKDRDYRTALVDQVVAVVESCPGITLGEISRELKFLEIYPSSLGFRSYYQLLMAIDQVESRFVDGEHMKDRMRFYVTSGNASAAPPRADNKAEHGKVPILGITSTWVSRLYDSVRALQRTVYSSKMRFTRK